MPWHELFLVLALAVIARIDLRTELIPNPLVFGAVALGIALAAFGPSPGFYLVGALAGHAIGYGLYKIGAIPGGDAKVLLLIGACAGARFGFFAAFWVPVVHLLLVLIDATTAGALLLTLVWCVRRIVGVLVPVWGPTQTLPDIVTRDKPLGPALLITVLALLVAGVPTGPGW